MEECSKRRGEGKAIGLTRRTGGSVRTIIGHVCNNSVLYSINGTTTIEDLVEETMVLEQWWCGVSTHSWIIIWIRVARV